jgi:hypothetical protein
MRGCVYVCVVDIKHEIETALPFPDSKELRSTGTTKAEDLRLVLWKTLLMALATCKNIFIWDVRHLQITFKNFCTVC